MTRWVVLFFFGLFVLSSGGEPLRLPVLKVGSTTYSNVTILGANATDLYFSHSLGFANVKLKYVGAELQKRYEYNPKVAEEAERKQAENDILYQSTLVKAQLTRSGKPKPSLGSETGLADPVSDRSLLGKQAPNLQLDKWLSEKPVLDGKFVLISFWAPWSTPCRQSIPELNALQKKYAEKLAVVGVSANSEAEINDMNEPKIEYASGLDAKAKLGAAAGVTSIPCVLLCDPKGLVLYQGHPAALTDKRLQVILAKSAD
jgi:thiol-disulfide isomerase/thioredoxin